MAIIVLIIIGLISSIIGSLIGVGEGIIIVPTLVFIGANSDILTGITIQTAIDITSLTLVLLVYFQLLVIGEKDRTRWCFNDPVNDYSL